ncbi:MAG TPA: AAA family ATPase [Thermomicrobiales bacterium]|nr:AAA family ATPase [Thermomicrobiales bacterium]
MLALANQKGGVGKTTTAVSIACYFASRGYSTLLIDIDPQGNATSSVGLEKRDLVRSTYDALVGATSADEAIVCGVRPGLDVLGANATLAGAEIELVDMRNRERRLQSAVAPVRDRYDAIVVDCPPSLGLLTINALTACDEVVVPIQCEYLALEGLMQLVNTIDLVKRRLNPNLDILGVAMTMFDSRTRLSTQVVHDVARFFPNRMFHTVVPRSVRLAEAPSYGQSIFEYDLSSRGAEAYQRLGTEIAARLGLNGATPAPTATNEVAALSQ